MPSASLPAISGTVGQASPAGVPAEGSAVAFDPASSGADTSSSSRALTASTIKIGFVDVVNNNEMVASFGVKGADTGDTRAQATAVIADINARGGLLGRKIVPVWATYDALSQESDDQQYASICATLTQDNHVFAVLAPWNTVASFATCLAKAHVLYLDDGLLQEDVNGFRSVAPWMYTGLLSLSRSAVAFAAGLHQGGFFTQTSKVGLVRFDYAEYKRASDDYLKPTLASFGVHVAAEAAVHRDSTSQLMADINHAVLQFKTAGVDRVIFLTAAGGTALFFIEQAQSQNYNPHYGFASPDSPAFLAQNLPASQLQGSMGVGWMPATDVADAQGPALTTAEKRCFAINQKYTGTAFSARSGAVTALAYCDLMSLLEDAANSGGTLSASSWVQGLRQLGRRHQTPLTFAAEFGPDRPDGGAAYRPLAYDGGCSCFRYTAAAQRVG